MIRDLSETLRAILTQPGLPAELAAAQVSFDRPAEPFNPTQTTIDLFLFDVRENLDLRSNDLVTERRNGKAVVQKPPRRVVCNYLITAWPVGGSDLVLQEHRLLTQVLRVLTQIPIIPANLAVGTIKTCDPPVPLQVAVGLPTASASEFWSALGGKLRAAATVQATIALPVYADKTVPLAVAPKVVTGERQPYPALVLNPAGREVTAPLFLFGRILGTDKAPAADATVEIVELGLRLEALPDGSFRAGPVPAGTYTLRATSGAAHAEVTRTVPITSGPYDIPLA